MNELMARSLSLDEIAKELLGHSDPGVAKLAHHVYEAGADGRDYESELEDAEDRAHEAEKQVEDLKELLDDCIQELPDSDAGNELRVRIKAWL